LFLLSLVLLGSPQIIVNTSVRKFLCFLLTFFFFFWFHSLSPFAMDSCVWCKMSSCNLLDVHIWFARYHLYKTIPSPFVYWCFCWRLLDCICMSLFLSFLLCSCFMCLFLCQ
jgi:hypothetical protein